VSLASQATPRGRIAGWLLLVMVALLGVTGLLAAPAGATTPSGASPETSVSSAAPAEASISIIMLGMSGLNMPDGTFNATFYLGVSCTAECDPAGWELVNANSMSSELVTEEAGQWWWRVQGTFVFQPDIRLFPFDTQQLPIVIEHKRLDSAALVYVPDVEGSEVSDDVAVPGWVVEPFTFTSGSTEYESLGADYSRVTFTVPVGRSTLASITKYYIPLVIFILLGVATLVLARSDYQIRTGGTALVGLTIFYLATSGGVATVGYLTLWDLSVLLGYLALGMVLVCGVIGAYLYHEGAYEGPEGDARNKRMRFRFLWAIVAVVALGSVGIALVGTLT
jgi:hypothetical protein